MSYLNQPMSINWRASLVPAAAVIPAPTAYTNIVAVKTLVVQRRAQGCGVWSMILRGCRPFLYGPSQIDPVLASRGTDIIGFADVPLLNPP
jgi:hypothetical protein